MSLGPKGVLEYTESDNGEYWEKSKDVFFGISTNTWLFGKLTADSESSGRADSEYIGISWIYWVGWPWEKEQSFFFFSAGIEIEGFWKKQVESRESNKIESFLFDLLISSWICSSIALEDRVVE